MSSRLAYCFEEVQYSSLTLIIPRRVAHPPPLPLTPTPHPNPPPSKAFRWHEAGYTQNVRKGLQPTPHWESAESKRRLNNLLDFSGAAGFDVGGGFAFGCRDFGSVDIPASGVRP
jgi:hypothetical protein